MSSPLERDKVAKPLVRQFVCHHIHHVVPVLRVVLSLHMAVRTQIIWPPYLSEGHQVRSGLSEGSHHICQKVLPAVEDKAPVLHGSRQTCGQQGHDLREAIMGKK